MKFPVMAASLLVLSGRLWAQAPEPVPEAQLLDSQRGPLEEARLRVQHEVPLPVTGAECLRQETENGAALLTLSVLRMHEAARAAGLEGYAGQPALWSDGLGDESRIRQRNQAQQAVCHKAVARLKLGAGSEEGTRHCKSRHTVLVQAFASAGRLAASMQAEAERGLAAGPDFCSAVTSFRQTLVEAGHYNRVGAHQVEDDRTLADYASTIRRLDTARAGLCRTPRLP